MILNASGGGEFSTSVEYVAETTAVATQTNGNTSITLTGIQSGDVVFFSWCADLLGATTLENSWAATEGSIWSIAPGGTAGQSNPNLAVYYKVATGNSITVDTGYTPTVNYQEYTMSLVAFRGLNTTTPLSLIGVNSLSGTSLNLPDYTQGLANFNSYLFAVVGLDDDINVTLTPPGTYTKINQAAANTSNGNNATQSSAYSKYRAGTSRSGEAYSSSSSDSHRTYLWLLLPSGEEAKPVITGSTTILAAEGGTAVATYTADNTVTWSLSGTDASLFSISSGGVVTYNSASTAGSYNITVTATNSNGLSSSLAVLVEAYGTSGNPGGNITFVGAVSDFVINGANTTLTLTGLQSGDVVYWMAASDNNSGSFLSESSGWSGWSSQDRPGSSSLPYVLRRYKVASGTSESVTLTVTTTTASYVTAAALFAFRGVDNSDPILTTGETTSNSSSVNATVAADFILADTVRVVWAGLDDDQGESSTPPTGYTEIVDQSATPGGTGTGNSATLAVAYKDVTGNTTEAADTFVFTSSDGTSSGSWQLKPD